MQWLGRSAVWSGFVVALVGFLPSVQADHTDPQAGHSMHGEAFNEGPRQAAFLMGGTGRVNLTVTTKVPKAQEFFNQGIGQLHGFWYFEAERSFRQVAALDPDCAMAYWGMAMANINNEKRAKLFITDAVQRKSKASPREQLWIDALNERIIADPKKDVERRRQYVRRLENIVHEHPTELEAKAFLIFTIWDNRSKLPMSSHQAVDTLISEVLAVEPMHPVHHYRIHLWDDEKAIRALKSAALCGQSAPHVAHMWHMPGHTFSKLNRYADAAWQQEAATRTDHAFMIRDRVMPDQIHNYAHNQEWLIRNLSYLGRAREAVDLAKNMCELPRHPKYNTPTKGSSFYGRMRLLENLTRYEMWDELIALAGTTYLDASGDRQEQAKRLRALGAAYFNTGDAENGRKQIEAVEGLLAAAKKEEAATQKKADEKKPEEKKPENKGGANQGANAPRSGATTNATQPQKKTPHKDIAPLEKAIAELQGFEAAARGDFKAALPLFAKAGTVSKETLSRMHLEAGDKAKAEQLAREAVTSGKGQVYPLANLAYILHRLDKSSEAGKSLDELRTLAYTADLNTAVMQRLAPLVKERGLAEDWRTTPASRDDIGLRPSLDSLGPVRWSPPIAPNFTVTDTDGKPRTLSDFRDRPVVFIFYLGSGCVHCVEQLKAFGPMAKAYEEAGIALLAVSTETVDEIKLALTKAGEAGQFVVPLSSGADLKAFKAFRAYDDFEQRPLHATVLVDGAGRIRWQDISYEPFADASFLLNEAKRLLSQAGSTPAAAASSSITARKDSMP